MIYVYDKLRIQRELISFLWPSWSSFYMERSFSRSLSSCQCSEISRKVETFYSLIFPFWLKNNKKRNYRVYIVFYKRNLISNKWGKICDAYTCACECVRVHERRFVACRVVCQYNYIHRRRVGKEYAYSAMTFLRCDPFPYINTPRYHMHF